MPPTLPEKKTFSPPLSCDLRMFKVHDKVCCLKLLFMMLQKPPPKAHGLGTFQKMWGEGGRDGQIRTILAPQWSSSEAPYFWNAPYSAWFLLRIL
jgi:hypothetical protein